MSDIFLLCPNCESALLEKTESGRVCPDCGEELTEIAYQMYHAQRASQVDSFFKKPGPVDRKSFGVKKKVATKDVKA